MKGFTVFLNDLYDNNIGLDSRDRDIILYLKKFMFGNKRECNVSIGRMARELNMCYKTAWCRLHRLAERGIIQIISGAKRGITNTYILLLDIFVSFSTKFKNEKHTKKSNDKKEFNQKEQPYQYSFKEKQHNAWYGYSQRKYSVDELERYLGLNHS
ncbi:hypothetical protein O163_08245 [Caldanaerobacter subterraneus subsp. yonseiensis KB-1]|uniref:Helix-turn-helix domain-containing protein n=1 Tax=Caldanaerobacter subterraneus subsp. yonseiensis KB-1 TaxID=1388761 RepID=U5CPK7_CALSX|nr:hypothetical protein [Caldanaerobacter subterraneus]ERM91928.1 hypothetical protein O163_08245 [Caldanaerobacter subterraneus subsp. yonseiensis KB-1]